MGWPQFLRLLNHDSVARTSPESDAPPAARRQQVASHPRVASVLGRLAAPLFGSSCPVPSNAPAGLRRLATRRWPQARSDPTSAPVSRGVRRLVVALGLPRESDSPVRGGREHCPCSVSASPRERCGLGRSPLLTAPVGVRSPERASVNTAHNPWSRGIFKFTGLSPKLSRYPQDFFRRPPVAHRSCTTMCTARQALRCADCIRAPNRVQWSPMTNERVAAIIIIP